MTSFSRTIVGIVFILTIVFCGTFIFSKITERMGGVDLTEGSVYTLSDGSKKIVEALATPLTMKLFYAKEATNKIGHDGFRPYNNYFYYVRDLLRAYERASAGKITLEEYDPRPYSDEADEADRLGIQRFPLTETEGFYFGLAVTSGSGAKETVPFFSMEMQPQIEYRISELIDIASRRKKTKLGVLSSLPIAGDGMSDYMRQMMQMQGRQSQRAWITIEQIKRTYEVEDVPADTDEIDSGLDYLMVVHPKKLPEKTLYAIDQFVMRGGKLVAFVDPHCMLADEAPQQPNNPMGGMNHDKSSELNRLFSKWGLELETGQFVGDLAIAQRLPTRTGQAVRFPGWVAMTGPECLPTDQVVTQGLDVVEAVLGGALRKTEVPDGVTVTPLLTTTDTGNTWTASSFELGGPMGMDPQKLAQKFSSGVEQIWLAAKVSGKLPSAFPDGAPADPADESETEGEEESGSEDRPHLAETAEENAVIIVADVDMLTDQGAFSRSFIGYEMRNSNLAFVTNALDHLAGSSALISIRTRRQFRRPFEVVDAIEARADRETGDKAMAIESEIKAFRDEISKLNQQATEENVGLLQSEALENRRKLEARVREKERELRDVQKTKLDAIDELGSTIKNINIFGVPAVVALIGVALFFVRNQRRREQVRGGTA